MSTDTDPAFHRLSEELLTLIVDSVVDASTSVIEDNADESSDDGEDSSTPLASFLRVDTLKALRLTHSCFAHLTRLNKILFRELSFFPHPIYRTHPEWILRNVVQYVERVRFGSIEDLSHGISLETGLREGDVRVVTAWPQIRTWFDSGELKNEWSKGLALMQNVREVHIMSIWIEPLQHTKPAKDGGMFNLALQCCIDAGIRPTKILVADREGRCDWTSPWWKTLDTSQLEDLHLATTRIIPEWPMCTTLRDCAHTLRRLTFGKGFQGQRWQDPSQFPVMSSLREMVLADGAIIMPVTLAVLLKLSPHLEHLEFQGIDMNVLLKVWRPVFMAIRAHEIGMLVVFEGIGYRGESEDEEEDEEDESIDFMTLRYHTTEDLSILEERGKLDDHAYKHDLCRYMSKVDVAGLHLPWNEAVPWDEDDDESESDDYNDE